MGIMPTEPNPVGVKLEDPGVKMEPAHLPTTKQPPAKPSFAKVAASAYQPSSGKKVSSADSPAPKTLITTSSITSTPSDSQNADSGSSRASAQAASPSTTHTDAKAKPSAYPVKKEDKANSIGQSAALSPSAKVECSGKSRPPVALVKLMATEESVTQLSSSSDSAKPASVDGKSVASMTTFAMDEKESLRPDDSASLRAIEEDVVSPPGSVAPRSRAGSDSGMARAFRDQLNEIAIMAPVAQATAVPGSLPNAAPNPAQALYVNNSQAPNLEQRSSLQPAPCDPVSIAGPQLMPAIPDEKLIEALESPRDRLFVLKLEQDLCDFVSHSNQNELSLPKCNSFYRLLAHRLADYYLLGHIVDGTQTGIKIIRTSYCRIPPPLSSLPVANKSTSTPNPDLPARKIMRRGESAKSGTNTTSNSEGPSKATSEVGGPAGSEASQPGSSEVEAKDRSALTREEREARYKEARMRIFGSAEDEEGVNDEGAGTGDDAARTMSDSTKKKTTRKQRNYDDDDFEARSQFNVHYVPQYPASGGYAGDGSGMIYAPYMGQMHNGHPGMNAGLSAAPYSGMYPAMAAPDMQYGWHQQPSHNGAMPYGGYNGALPAGYDLSAEFQRGMQSFQSAGMPNQASPMVNQVTPKMATVPMASHSDNYQMQNPPGTEWPQMAAQLSFSPDRGYASSTAGESPSLNPVPFGALPPASYHGGLPTNYSGAIAYPSQCYQGGNSRQLFNPQSQTFVPGGCSGAYPVQPNMVAPPMPHPGPYPNFQMAGGNQMAPQMAPQMLHQTPRRSPSHHSPAIDVDAPYGPQNNVALTTQSKNHNVTQSSTPASSHPNPTPSQSSSSLPAHSTIAKWGTPSHLPAKPPPSAQTHAPKVPMPGHSYQAIARQQAGLSMTPSHFATANGARGGPNGHHWSQPPVVQSTPAARPTNGANSNTV